MAWVPPFAFGYLGAAAWMWLNFIYYWIHPDEDHPRPNWKNVLIAGVGGGIATLIAGYAGPAEIAGNPLFNFAIGAVVGHIGSIALNLPRSPAAVKQG